VGENRDQITKDFDTEQVKREKYIRERIADRGYERTKSIWKKQIRKEVHQKTKGRKT
jgi:hypothetical protein